MLIHLYFHTLLTLAYHVTGVITEAPQITEAVGLGARILRVSWAPISSSVPVTGYRAMTTTFNNVGHRLTRTLVADPNVSTFVFHNVGPYDYTGTTSWNYTVSVLAFNSDGNGPSSDQFVILPRKYVRFF